MILLRPARRLLMSSMPIIVWLSPLFAQPAATTRDYEIAAVEKTLARTRDPLLAIGGHLNLGDLRGIRGDASGRMKEYGIALALAEESRKGARSKSDERRYATMTLYAGLANAKLGKRDEAYDLLEESLRYSSDSPQSWNVYSSAMRLLGQTDLSVEAAANAVTIQTGRLTRDSPASDLLSLHIYEYAYASTLLERGVGDDLPKSLQLLERSVASLNGDRFTKVRAMVVARERFEVLATTSDDASSYVTLLNRSRLQLATLYRKASRPREAMEQFEAVLELRPDDVDALRGLASVRQNGSEASKLLGLAFEANPYSLGLVLDYEKSISPDSDTPETMAPAAIAVRRALLAYREGDFRGSLEALEPLIEVNRDNETLRFLSLRNQIALGARELAPEIERLSSAIARDQLRELLSLHEKVKARMENDLPFLQSETGQEVRVEERDLARLVAAIQGEQLSPAQRTRLDRTLFSSAVRAERVINDSRGSSFDSATVGSLRIRFPHPTTFNSRLDASSSVRLVYKVLGVVNVPGQTGTLLVAPVSAVVE